MSVERLSPWQWREEILTAVTPPRSVDTVPLEQARGRVLAAAVRSPEQVPALPIAAMDGFAVRRADLTAPGTTVLDGHLRIPAVCVGFGPQRMRFCPATGGWWRGEC